jgi:hypothetical protein
VAPGGDSEDRKSNWAGHVTAAHVLRTVVGRFEGRGIEVVPVKGVVTARTLYEDIASRHSGDIDLRIRRTDFRRAIGVARASGWPATADAPILWQSVLRVMGCEVDVEGTIGPPGLCMVSVDDILRRARCSGSRAGGSRSTTTCWSSCSMLSRTAFAPFPGRSKTCAAS